MADKAHPTEPRPESGSTSGTLLELIGQGLLFLGDTPLALLLCGAVGLALVALTYAIVWGAALVAVVLIAWAVFPRRRR